MFYECSTDESDENSYNVDCQLELNEFTNGVIDISPQSTALTIEVKLSLRRIISAAYLATYVPVIPIANPTSAFFKAGASLVPSPVTATTCPLLDQ